LSINVPLAGQMDRHMIRAFVAASFPSINSDQRLRVTGMSESYSRFPFPAANLNDRAGAWTNAGK
jgi:hypothetical protein